MSEPGEEFAIYSSASEVDQGLPPDPQGMNADRADLAFFAMREFASKSNTDPENVLKDLLCDMMHWCDRHNVSFAVAMDSATHHYSEETRAETPLSEQPWPKPIATELKPTNEIKMPF